MRLNNLGTTAHPYYWLCLTAPPVTQNLRGQAPIAFLSRALGTPSLAAALSTVLRCFSKGWRSRIFVKMSAVFSSVPRYLTVTNPAPRIYLAVGAPAMSSSVFAERPA